MIFLQIPTKVTFSLNNTLLFKTKFLSDFLFFIFLLKELLNIYDVLLKYTAKKIIYLLNLIAVKYTLCIKYLIIIEDKECYTFKIYTLQLIYWYSTYSFSSFSLQKNRILFQKILFIKKISRTKTKGRVRRYKVLLLIGTKSG